MSPRSRPTTSSPFSDFIRNASPEEKKRVYLAVMERATERQLQTLRSLEAKRHMLESAAQLQASGATPEPPAG